MTISTTRFQIRSIPTWIWQQLTTTSDSRLIYYLAFLAGFAIPTSTSLQNITITIISVWVIIKSKLRAEIRLALGNWFILFAILLYVVCLLWSFDSQAASPLHMLGKMRIFIMSPLIYVFCCSRPNRVGLMRGFFFGAILSLIVSLVMYLLHKPMLSANTSAIYGPGDWPSFRYHTDHNYFLGLMLIGIINLFIYYRDLLSKRNQWLLILLTLVTGFDIFYLVQGRAGQALFIGMLLATFMLWSWRRGLVVLIIMLIVLPIMFYTSQAMQNGIRHIFIDVHSYKQGISDTSIGYRLEYHRYSKELIAKRPILGYGTGSFQEVYHKYTGFVGERDPRHPHNDFYWLWVELGILGPTLLLLMTLSLIFNGLSRIATPEGKALIIVAVSYVIGAMQGGFYTDNITSSAFMLIVCVLLCGSDSFKSAVLKKSDL